VRIDVDVSDRDSFGRILRYVFLTDGTFFNAVMVREGWAQATDFPPDSKHASMFGALESAANAANRGQWGSGCSPAGGGGGGGGGNCHPSYPDFCIAPPPPDLDCADINGTDFTVTGSDPHRLDGDDDGIGCES
jgi:micrococcal nuclease